MIRQRRLRRSFGSTVLSTAALRGQYQRQAHHQIGEVEALLRQGLQDLAEVAALGAILEQQTDAQLIAAIKGIVRGAQSAVEIQRAAVIAAHLTFIHRLTQLVDPLPLVVEQLHSHLVPRLQWPSQLPLTAHHQIEAAAVAFIEQGVAGESGQRIVGGAQHQRLGTAQPAAGIESAVTTGSAAAIRPAGQAAERADSGRGGGLRRGDSYKLIL